MLLAIHSQLRFAAVLLAFCHARAGENYKTLVSSHNHNNTLANHVFGNENEKRCSWNCSIIESDLTEEMKITVAKKKMIRLVVKYKKKVDDKCENQVSRNSSGNVTEHWLIWLANRKLSTFTKALEGLTNMMFYTHSNEEYKEIRAMCVLQVMRTTATTTRYSSGIQYPLFSQLEREFNNTYCNTNGSNSLQPCLNISTSTGNFTTNSEGPFKHG